MIQVYEYISHTLKYNLFLSETKKKNKKTKQDIIRSDLTRKSKSALKMLLTKNMLGERKFQTIKDQTSIVNFLFNSLQRIIDKSRRNKTILFCRCEKLHQKANCHSNHVLNRMGQRDRDVLLANCYSMPYYYYYPLFRRNEILSTKLQWRQK